MCQVTKRARNVVIWHGCGSLVVFYARQRPLRQWFAARYRFDWTKSRIGFFFSMSRTRPQILHAVFKTEVGARRLCRSLATHVSRHEFRAPIEMSSHTCWPPTTSERAVFSGNQRTPSASRRIAENIRHDSSTSWRYVLSILTPSFTKIKLILRMTPSQDR